MPRRLAAALLLVLAAGCGSSAPLTHVQRCTAAYQVLADDGLAGMPASKIRAYGTPAQIRHLNAAMRACSGLTRAQIRAAIGAVSP